MFGNYRFIKIGEVLFLFFFFSTKRPLKLWDIVSIWWASMPGGWQPSPTWYGSIKYRWRWSGFGRTGRHNYSLIMDKTRKSTTQVSPEARRANQGAPLEVTHQQHWPEILRPAPRQRWCCAVWQVSVIPLAFLYWNSTLKVLVITNNATITVKSHYTSVIRAHAALLIALPWAAKDNNTLLLKLFRGYVDSQRLPNSCWE